ncbi:024L [Cherax quadricarinatus iridovirus]|uniref:Uncharacterized protein n=1 Tax=Shrimp hemocyte iridescent virus TaxID=2039780 RepID=A0A291B0W5_9VIRU|nr:024L [Cherax quadricarinatus iridovirus]YP_010084879.1 hypothetical protein KM509_gp127 [Shrimp hemocyte iridescent virus]UPA43343.1 hypothetical protein 4TH000069 [Iridovirus CN01]ASZ85004.1 024L [Cherax quadricarinatus iridovirus]ATE87136.1 hypothetical protein [Shrimp hemocyte iridescent virus]UPA43578.1 hypothetical protein 3TG000145 [Iridovirus CN01]
MDDIMNLMNKMILDVHSSFDKSQFGIFNDDEQHELELIWDNVVEGDVKKFINILSPAQKNKVGIWASNRTEYPVPVLLNALKGFIKYLESSSYKHHQIYPKQIFLKQEKKKKKSKQ